MQESNIVVGLDIGTTKVCVVVAEKDEFGNVNVLGKGQSHSDGLCRSTVVNINKTVAAIRAAVADAERESSIQIRAVNVGISGSHVHCFQSYSEISINQTGTVNESDVRRFLEKARSSILNLDIDHEIIHVIPQEFTVDDQGELLDPIGMAGTTMQGSAYIVVGLKTKIRNIRQCVERAGLHIGALTFEPIASGMAVIKEREKKGGVLVMDIGGGTTDVAVSINGSIRYSEVIPVAANDITLDIAHGVKVLEEVAEELKRLHGCAYSKLSGKDEELLIEGIEGRPQKSFSKNTLTLIIEARMTEILELVRHSLERTGFYEYLNAGAIITGGGSLLPGVRELASHVLGLDVRTGYPEGVSGGIKGSVNNPVDATVMGLVAHAFQNDHSVNRHFSVTKVEPPAADSSPGVTAQVSSSEKAVLKEDNVGWQKISDGLQSWWAKL